MALSKSTPSLTHLADGIKAHSYLWPTIYMEVNSVNFPRVMDRKTLLEQRRMELCVCIDVKFAREGVHSFHQNLKGAHDPKRPKTTDLLYFSLCVILLSIWEGTMLLEVGVHRHTEF